MRGAEAVLRRTNDVDAAVAYLRDVRERRGHFVRSFSSGAKTYTPWWKNAPAPFNDDASRELHPVAENKSNVVAFRRSNKPGAIDDEKVFEKVSAGSDEEKKPFPTGTLPPRR